ncbi:MAG: N-acetylneuraminate synthase family protein, partial [Bdellovibrionaceae bacterium]|nr:N-acetylneuraminate synthase family protein [Pseudobdellovibrionaceae bacterium]
MKTSVSQTRPSTRIVKVGPVSFGGSFTVIAGPCSIEDEHLFTEVGQFVRKHGAVMLRGGIWKLRTSAESFQGLGSSALEFVPRVKEELGLPFVAEVTDPRQIDSLFGVVDMFQVGSRNMHNYELLKELGRTRKPVLLKRGFAALIS